MVSEHFAIFNLSQLSSACQTWQISKNQIKTLNIKNLANAKYSEILRKVMPHYLYVMLDENKESS